MNSKIQQVMDRAFTDEQGEQFDVEKFAELIVRECASIVETAEPYQSSDLIKQRFGIAE